MKKLPKIFVLICICVMCAKLKAQTNVDSNQSIGFSAGVTFLGPLNKMSKFLESKGFGITSDGFIFGPTNYPVKTGPRGDFSLAYSFRTQKEKEFEIEFNLVQLGEIAGLNNSGDRLEVGFNSYTFGASYRFGSRLTKLNIGPTLMFNRSYSLDLESFDESKQTIETNLTAGIKFKALLYLWNRDKTYGNIGTSYLFSYAVEHGPFPVDGDSDASDSLPPTKLNFGYGSAFFAFGVKF